MNVPLAPIPRVAPGASAMPTSPQGLSAPKVLLMGPPGTGKTWSIATLLAAGLEVFVLIMEPGGDESLLEAIQRQKLPVDKLHWAYVPPTPAGWDALNLVIQTVNMQSFQAISDMKAGIAKNTSNSIMLALRALQNFRCARTGQDYGDVTTWGTDRALVFDSLSGLNALAIQNTVGLKPTMAPGEWNVAMNIEEMLINKMTADLKCFFVLLAHVDRNLNEVSGAMQITPAAIGNKLGPRLGRFFSEIILTKKNGASFTWSTAEMNTDVKQRSLPLSDKLEPTFLPIVNAFRARDKLVHAEANKPT